MHWSFAIKYWIISKEVPRLFTGDKIAIKESTYTIIKVIGWVVNTLPLILLGYWRGILSYESAASTSNKGVKRTTKEVQILYQVMCLI